MTVTTKRNGTRVDVAAVKAAASGRWPEVLERVAGIDGSILDGKHHPCPGCGGTDRFRFSNLKGNGSTVCNQCGNTGDGLAAIQKYAGLEFFDALQRVADYLGVRSEATSGYASRIPEWQLTGSAVEQMAAKKRCPVESLNAYGAAGIIEAKWCPANTRVTFPMFDETGRQCSTFTVWPNRHKDSQKSKGLNEQHKPAGLFLPMRTPNPGETWMITEGVKDAAALHGLGFNACGMPGNEMSAKFAGLFQGVNTVLIPDRDKAGVVGAEKTAKALQGVAGTIRIAELPLPLKAKKGGDVRDVLVMPDGENLVRQAIEGAKPYTGKSRPMITLQMDESAVSDAVIDALGKHGDDDALRCIYQRNGQLVHLVRSPAIDLAGVAIPDGMLRIRPLPLPCLRERITAAVTLCDDRGHIRPPDWLTKAIYYRGEYSAAVRPLAGIVRCPTLRPDGTVLQVAGYDPPTGLLYEPDGKYPLIPDMPSRDDAIRAAADLLDVVCDFPFAGDTHKAAWLALPLTLIGRAAIRGPVPLFAIDANTRGSGKTLSSDAAGMIAYGHPLARKSWPSDDAETRKTITAIALEGTPAVLLDNIASTLGNASLDAALTGTTWQDRILGENKTTGELPLTTVWIASGNNLILGADTARRTLYCRLESLEENPEDRQGFRHPNLIGWVRQNRSRLAAAAVTILRAYVAAGKPDQKLTPWGSYESWSEIIRGAIAWCGLPDPADTRVIVREADRTGELLRLLLAGIEEADSGDGVTAAEIARLLAHPVGPDDADAYPTLRAAIGELCDKPTSRKIGYKLRAFAGRVCGGRRLMKTPGHGGVMRWAVERVSGGDGGDGGDDFAPLARAFPVNPQDSYIAGDESSPPCQPSPPCQLSSGCDHNNPATWVHRAGKAFCPGCDKFLGRVHEIDSPSGS